MDFHPRRVTRHNQRNRMIFIAWSHRMDGALMQVVREYNKDNLVMVLDNERRSRETVSKMQTLIDNDYQLCIWPENNHHKAINEMILAGMTSAEIQKQIKENISVGLSA